MTTPAGWYPAEGGEPGTERYWDGSQWTEHTRPVGAPPPPPSVPQGQHAMAATATITPAAPVRVCKKCQTQAQTTGPTCPHCGKKYKSHTVRNVILGLVAAIILLVGGCAVLFGAAVKGASDALDAEQKAHAITPAVYESIPLGATEAQVKRAALPATPEDAQEFTSKGVLDSKDVKSSCIYFNKSGGKFGDIYQFCFTNGKLDNKNAF